MSVKQLQRREFLRRSSALGLMGTAAPWALNLAAMAEASAQTASDYKALVCVFFYGGNDYANTVVPYDATTYASYAQIRQTLATARDQLLPLTPSTALPGGAQLALAPQLTRMKGLFDAGSLGVLLNVGTLVQPTTLAQYQAQSVPLPPKLFSHNDQQSVWQASSPEGAISGWGGRMGDLFLSGNGNATFTCINVSGNAVFMAGQQAVQYQIAPSGAVAINAITKPLYGSQACADALRSLITANNRSHWMESELNTVVSRSVNAQGIVSSALAGLPALATPFDTANNLAMQLQMVAKLIAARSSLGAKRQVFFVSLGGFDLHDFLVDQHPGLLSNIDGALGSFQAAMTELGVAQQVTAFTASDFGRTLTSNGDGSDHGWGSHHFVMGGAVKGGRFIGDMPEYGLGGAHDVGQGRLLPGTAVDQLGATLATWMGVSAGDLPLVLPQIGNYSVKDIGIF
ncbi:DUF1501 domain-containing protein [Burkholderiaceae bacterium UC74_6]